MHPVLEFQLRTNGASATRQVQINRAIIAGWTSRDTEAMQAHIDELAELGVKPPDRTPIFYRVSARRIMTGRAIEAVGTQSSGEAEFVLIRIDGEIWVGTGSDHTDRAAEAHGVTLSKQMCDKPIAPTLWRLADVAPHWEQLRLTAWIEDGGEIVVYQDGPVSTMRSPDDLIARFANEDTADGLGDGDLMMCGTLPAIGGVRPSARFSFALADPIRNETIRHDYNVVSLPDWG